MPHSSILNLRKTLHQHPELSGAEWETAQRIRRFIKKYQPTKIIDQLGGTGLAAVYQFGKGGKTIAIRCELDALPIAEKNTFPHRSLNQGVSHKCGHDGHMAIVAGLAPWLQKENFPSGKVVLLFQPAEETGQGARRVVEDPKFQALQTDYIFALHNIPGAPLHQIILNSKGFSAEVQSFSLTLEGKVAHAAEPERGINPALALAEIVATLDQLNRSDPHAEDFAILTPVHINMGQKAYGISAGKTELHYTIRTWSSSSMSELKSRIANISAHVAQANKLNHHWTWFEYFPASENDPASNERVLAAVRDNGFSIQERPYPFKFGEDFGWYSKYYKTAMFGLGAGENCPALHHEDYDFPDALIESGNKIFQAIITNIFDTPLV